MDSNWDQQATDQWYQHFRVFDRGIELFSPEVSTLFPDVGVSARTEPTA